MTSEEFSAGDWVDRLARALPKLAEAQQPFLSRFPGFRLRTHDSSVGRNRTASAFPQDDLRMLYARARHCNVSGEGKDFEPLLAVLNPVRHIVNSHRTLARVVSPIIGRDEFWMQILNSGRQTCATDLIAGLMARADELSDDRFRTVARELNAFLAPGDEAGSAGVLGGLDVGYDAVLFYGATLSERIEVAEGMALLPFEDVRAIVDESLAADLAPAGAGFHDWRSVGATVRAFRWKPEFRRAGDLRDSEPKSPGRFFQEARIVLELLAVSQAAPVLCLAELSGCIDRSAGGSLAWNAGASGSIGAGRRSGSTGSSRPRH